MRPELGEPCDFVEPAVDCTAFASDLIDSSTVMREEQDLFASLDQIADDRNELYFMLCVK